MGSLVLGGIAPDLGTVFKLSGSLLSRADQCFRLELDM
jgi:hypothetical protein